MIKASLMALALMFTVSVNAETYKVDTTNSTLHWKGSKLGGSSHEGNVAIKEGTLTIDNKGNPVSANVVIDMTKITNLDLASKPDMQAKLVGHLTSDDFFNVEKYPTATFVSKRVTKQGDTYLVKGDLTIRDKTQEIEFPAKIKTSKNDATAEAKLTIDRAKHDVKYASTNFFKKLADDKIIKNEIEFDLKIVAKK